LSALFEETPFPEQRERHLYFLNYAVSLLLLLTAIIIGPILKNYFKKSTSEEIFFFILFLLTLSIEAVRTGQLLLFLYNQPSYYGALITRTVYFGRILGALALLISGLFAAGFTYQKYGLFVGVIILISIAFAGTIPVDSTTLLPHLLYKIGNSSVVWSGLLAIKIIAVVNYLFAGYLKNNNEYFLMGISILLIVIGYELLINILSLPFIFIGAVLIAVGSVVFSNRIHSVYMWY
jgi:hypothetical protein